MSEPAALAFDEREYSLAQLEGLANGMATTPGASGGARRRPGRADVVEPARVRVALRAIWRLGAAAVLLSPAWREPKSSMRSP